MHVKNFRVKKYTDNQLLEMYELPQIIDNLDGTFTDIEEYYGDVKDYVLLGEEPPEELKKKATEYADLVRHYVETKVAKKVVIEDPSIEVEARGRSDFHKQVEEQAGIKYPREIVHVDNAPDTPGIIILPYDDYDTVYLIKDDGSFIFLDEYEEGMERPYYKKLNGETRIYTYGFSAGAGTQSDPYLVSTPQDLIDIRNNASAYYIQINDIDMTGVSYSTPFRPQIYFYGSYDGQDYSIKNLNIDDRGQSVMFSGLFGGVHGVIKNIKMINPTIYHDYSYSSFLVAQLRDGGVIENCFIEGGYLYNNGSFNGGIAGMAIGTSTITNCHLDSTTSIISTGNYSGGIVGEPRNISVKNCSNGATIEGNGQIGGISGYMAAYSGNLTVEQCYNYGKIICKINSAGGCFGQVSKGTYINCYNSGEVVYDSTNANRWFGGFAGYIHGSSATIRNCFTRGVLNYSENNAFTAVWASTFNPDNFSGIYYNSTTTSSTDTYAQPLTDTEMQNSSNFPNYDFVSIWVMETYPELQQNKQTTTNPDLTPPDEVSNLQAVVTTDTVDLSWINPTTEDFSYINIYRNNTLIADNITSTAYQDTGLQPATTYTYKITTVDTSGNESLGETITITTESTDPQTIARLFVQTSNGTILKFAISSLDDANLNNNNLRIQLTNQIGCIDLLPVEHEKAGPLRISTSQGILALRLA